MDTFKMVWKGIKEYVTKLLKNKYKLNYKVTKEKLVKNNYWDQTKIGKSTPFDYQNNSATEAGIFLMPRGDFGLKKDF